MSGALIKERTRLRNQLTSWLATWGCAVSLRRRQAPGWWTQVRDWAHEPLPVPVQVRLARAHERLTLLAAQVATIDRAQAAQVRRAAPTRARASWYG